MDTVERKMLLSPVWLAVAIITFILGFSVLGYLAVRISTDHPPMPSQVQTSDGTTLFTAQEIMAGQHLFQSGVSCRQGLLTG